MRDTPKPADGVKVAFATPGKLTDVKTAVGTEAMRDAVLEELREHVVRVAAPQLPANSTLRVAFTDIDLAGEHEPWRGPGLNDTRFMRATYPSRLKFEFTLTDASGAVLKQGLRELTDLHYQMRAAATPVSDGLRFEKALLTDWVRDECLRTR